LGYVRAVSKRNWHQRIPVVWLENLDTATLSGKLYQAFFIFAFLLIPTAGLIHFLDKVSSINVLRDGQPFQQTHFFDWVPADALAGHKFSLGNGIGNPPAEVAFWPNGQPIIFALLVALVCQRRSKNRPDGGVKVGHL